MRITPFILAFSLAVRLSAQAPDPVVEAHELNQKGVAQYEKGSYDEAISLFERALVLDPKNEAMRRNLARSLHATSLSRVGEEHYDRSVKDLKRAMDLDGKEPSFPSALARVYRERGELLNARRLLTVALEKFPTEAALFVEMARIEYVEEELSRALELLDAAKALAEDDGKSFATFHEKVRREAKIEGGYLVERRGDFAVKYDDAEFRRASQQVLDMLDAEYNRLGAAFRHWPKQRVAVILYTRQDYDRATGAHGWTGGLYDGKIRLPVRNFSTAARQIESTLIHELSHLFVRSVHRACPVWLDEGIAQLREQKSRTIADGEVRDARKNGQFVSILKMPLSWSGIKDAATVRIYYAEALSFCAYLDRRFGFDGIVRFLEALASRKTMEEAMTTVFGRSSADLEREWLETL